jgi:hypothetical protein
MSFTTPLAVSIFAVVKNTKMKPIAMLTTPNRVVPFVQTTSIGTPASVNGTATNVSGLC